MRRCRSAASLGRSGCIVRVWGCNGPVVEEGLGLDRAARREIQQGLQAQGLRFGRRERDVRSAYAGGDPELADVAGFSCDGISGRRVGSGAAAVGGGSADVPPAGTARNRRSVGAPFGCAVCRLHGAGAAVAGGEFGG